MNTKSGCVVGMMPEHEGGEEENRTLLQMDVEELMRFIEDLMEEKMSDPEKVELFVRQCLVGCHLTWEGIPHLDDSEIPSRKDSFMRVKPMETVAWRGQRLRLDFPLVWKPEAIQSRVSLLRSFLKLLDKRQRTVMQAREEDNVTRETVAMLIHNARNQVASLVGALDLVITAAEKGDMDWAQSFLVGNKEPYRATMQNFSKVTSLAMRLAMSDDQFEPSCKNYTIDQLRFELKKQYNEHNVELAGLLMEREVMVDIGLFQQILENMVINALKYGHARALPLTIRLTEQDENLRLEVEDRGDGFPGPAEPLFVVGCRGDQRKTVVGYGLGLAFCKRMVAKMGGEVFAYNNKGGIGATFGFTLPLKK